MLEGVRRCLGPAVSWLFLAAVVSIFSPARLDAQIISEFLAQNHGPLVDEDGDSSDWIEIQNPTAETINLRDWSLTDTRTNLTLWSFPSTNLAPHAALVVFASGKDRRISGTTLHTNFKLDADGEYLALVAPGGTSVVSAFDPAYPPQLPNVSYGLSQLAGSVPVLAASAAARILVPEEGGLGNTWTTRDFDDSLWTQAKNGVGYETSPADYASLIQTDVRTGMATHNSCYIRLPFNVDDPAGYTSWRLLVQYDDGFIAYLNGVEIARSNAPDNANWDSAATANHPDDEAVVPEEFPLAAVQDLIVRGLNVLAIHGLNTGTSSSDFLIRAIIEARPLTSAGAAPAYFTTPTPGAPNIGGVPMPGPIVRNVTHLPNLPEPGQNLTVQAMVVPTLQPIETVRVHHQVMFEPANELPMWDDGAHQDGAAGDGIYGATIPVSEASAGEMIRYYVTATDKAGQTSRLPVFVDPLDSSQFFGTIIDDITIQSHLPIVHWFVQNPGAADTPTGTRCALFYGGEFYDNVLFSLRGQSSSGFPKKGYNLDFPRDHRFLYSTNGARVKDIKLLSNWGDKARVRNALAYEMIRQAGSVGHFSFQVRVQQNGAFHGILDLMEDADERWMERVGRDGNGALYKMYNSLNSAAGNEKKTRKGEDFSDLQALVDNLAPSRSLASRVQYGYDALDLPQVISYFTALALISSQDHGHKNFFLYRDTEGSGEWAIFPWDVDLSWGRNWTDSGGYFTDTLYQNNVLNFYNQAQQSKPSNRLYDLIFAHPDFRHMYLRRLRSVMDAILKPPGTESSVLGMEARIQQMMDAMDPPDIGMSDADLDYAKWGSWGNQNRMRAEAGRIITQHLPGRRTFLFTSEAAVLNGERIPEAQPTNAAVVFGALDFNPTSGKQSEEFIQIQNLNDFALDLSGWKVSGAIDFTLKPGTVLPAQGSLYLSPNVTAFRARSSGPKGGQGLFVQGNYRGQLSARGETLRITDGTGRLVTQTNYTGAPTLAQQFLRVTELMYHPEGPAANSPYATEEFEFIELQNIGTAELDLTGVQFTRGVTFSFTGSAVTRLSAGARVLLVKNPAAFTSRYGNGLPVAGTYLGSLENAGETLRLEDAVGEVIAEFSFSPEWQPVTDGLGYSLELVDVNQTPDLAAHWRVSGQKGGSPGNQPANALAISRVTFANGQLVLSFVGNPGPDYVLEHRTALRNGQWEALQSIASPSSVSEVQVTVPWGPVSSEHYFRLRHP